MSSAESGFDLAAARYDEDERDNPVLRHLRDRSRAHLHAHFHPADRLLELGSGTGAEAAGLALRGARVALLDASSRMLALATARVAAVRPEALLGAHLLPAGRVGELVAEYGAGSFDGAYSSLGPLNCEPALGPVADGLAALVRPGGVLVLSVMNRLCAVESVLYALRGPRREALRRYNGPVWASSYAGGPKDVRTYYYSRREIERAFLGAFRVEHGEALPLLWPPTYRAHLVRAHPALFRALEPLEARLARWPVLRDLGDHILLRLRRRSAGGEGTVR